MKRKELLPQLGEEYPCKSMCDPPTSNEVHDIILGMKDSSAGHDDISALFYVCLRTDVLVA